MRLDPDGDLTAEVLVNELPESELAEIFWRYGEERYSRRIAQNLAHVRRDRPITTTVELAEIVRAAQPAAARRGGTIDPATRVFQALRIAVNDEIGRIERLLARVDAAASGRADWLAEDARVAFISFHSLEDRLVKQSVRRWSERGWAEALTRKPVTASEAETLSNPRARSAKLRAARLIGRTDPG
jgi:16S rRNA (cytosine1402-N4)-methyltransferase